MNDEREVDSSLMTERPTLDEDDCREEIAVTVLRRRSEDDVNDAAQIEIPGHGDDEGIPAGFPPAEDEDNDQAVATT